MECGWLLSIKLLKIKLKKKNKTMWPVKLAGATISAEVCRLQKFVVQVKVSILTPSPNQLVLLFTSSFMLELEDPCLWLDVSELLKSVVMLIFTLGVNAYMVRCSDKREKTHLYRSSRGRTDRPMVMSVLDL